MPLPSTAHPPSRRSRLVILGVLLLLGLAAAVALISRQQLAAWFAGRTSPVQAAAALYPAVENSILFKSNNGEPKNNTPASERDIPHLVLFKNGKLTEPASRTVFIDLDWQLARNRRAALDLVLETQNGNPDAGGGAVNRLAAWQTRVSLPAASLLSGKSGSLRLAYTFPAEWSLDGTESSPTPTGYYRLKIVASSPGEKGKTTIYEQDYALLLENQIRVPLVQPDGHAPGPQALVVYFTDMTPFQINSYGLHNRIPRAAVNAYVEYALVPGMQEILQLLNEEWGFTWHPAWRSFREGDEKNLLTVALTDEEVWYHGPAPEGGFGLISINVHQLKLRNYNNTTEWILSIFGHELFHNLQRSLNLESGATGDIEGRQDAWEIVTEGSAMLIEALTREELNFSPGLSDDPYSYHMRSFVHSLETNNSTAKASYRNISPYDLVVYWRFLYDQCRQGLASDAATGERLEFLRTLLRELYSDLSLLESTREELPQNFESLMDRVFASYPHCPYTSYQESLASFARILYTLRAEPPGQDTSITPAVYSVPDPGRPPPDAVPSAALLDYRGLPLIYTDQIASSYGIDFIEIALSGEADGPLNVEFQCLSSDTAQYQLQVVQDPGADGEVGGARQVIFTGYTAENGQLHFLLEGLDPALASRLGVIITRVDSRELEDTTGSYQLDIRPATEPGPR